MKGPAAIRRWWQGVDAERRSSFARKCGIVLAWFAVIACCAWGMAALEQRVSVHPQRKGVAVRVRLCGVPEWMPAELAGTIAESILPESADLNDWGLTEQAFSRAAANPWIRKVCRVEKRLTEDPRVGVLEVHAEYRKPAALVRLKGGSYAYVSDDAHRLPDEVPQWVAKLPAGPGKPENIAYFLRESDVPPGIRCVGVHYVVIDGVAHDPPEPGHRWGSDDILDGLKLIAILWDRPSIIRQVKSVDVRNFSWRASKYEPQLRLIAQRGDEPETVILFGRFPNPEGDYVVPTERKLCNLDLYMTNHRGTLGGLARKIDLQTDPATFVPY
ncbi:MAG TPA: hypothetical protein VM098_07785 [Phycisphaerae bacterium]|nr:hypothetical protein [Phycisphaerae bacterium]